MGHPIHKFIMDNSFMRYLLIAIIIVWMFPIMKPFVLWAKKELKGLKGLKGLFKSD